MSRHYASPAHDDAAKAAVAFAANAAAAALPGWSATPTALRVQVLARYLALCQQHAEAFVDVLATVHGKTVADARAEIARGIEMAGYALGSAPLFDGELCEQSARATAPRPSCAPPGVVAGIVPFRLSALVPMWMLVPALARGHTFILKPASRDARAALLHARLLKLAGLPDGAFNVVQADDDAVGALVAQPQVREVSFVGTDALAHIVRAGAVEHGKRAHLLCAARHHLIVLPDAELALVVDVLIGSVYDTHGERIMPPVVLAVGDVGARLVAALAARIAAMAPRTRAASGLPDPHERVERLLDEAVAQGAKLVLDRRYHHRQVDAAQRPRPPGCALLDHVTASMTLYKEDIYAPILCVMRLPDTTTALKLIAARDHHSGVSVFTRDGAAGRALLRRIYNAAADLNVALPWARGPWGSAPRPIETPDSLPRA